jgi:hypothetical protein
VAVVVVVVERAAGEEAGAEKEQGRKQQVSSVSRQAVRLQQQQQVTRMRVEVGARSRSRLNLGKCLMAMMICQIERDLTLEPRVLRMCAAYIYVYIHYSIDSLVWLSLSLAPQTGDVSFV